jgi:antitoxin (DNA-binding transcriptional repressor) of toxin-antitoxin stability system
MKERTIREAREGLSHPEIRFTYDEDLLVVMRGDPVARILPVMPKRKVRSLVAFRTTRRFQGAPSETTIREYRDARR